MLTGDALLAAVKEFTIMEPTKPLPQEQTIARMNRETTITKEQTERGTEMKPFEYYSKPQTLYPNKKDYITFYVYDKGELLFAGFASTNSKIKLKEDYPNAVIQEVLDEEGYKAHRKEYDDERNKLHQEFQNDLFEDYGVSDNPKRFKCFDLAWEHGHSSGLEEVYNYFGDFVELIRE